MIVILRIIARCCIKCGRCATGVLYAARRAPTLGCRTRRALVSVLRRDARCLFLVAVAVTAHEFVDAAGCIDKFLLAGEEGVR